MSNCTFTPSPLLARCDCSLPWYFCATGNVAGLCSTAMWFLVLLPQVWKCARAKSVQGLSAAWAIMNFTAALNNTFFVFKLGDLPVYSQVSAVYMPVLELLLLLLFLIYTESSTKKWILTSVLCVFWVVLCLVQSLADVYMYLEWLSIALWSAETFPQVWLNSSRHSTQGLSDLMVLLTTIGKTTDFMSTYVLRMPLQYVIMAYFSSSVAIVQSVQVLWYWRQAPVSQIPTDVHEMQSANTQCLILRILGISLLMSELSAFVAGLYWRGSHWMLMVAPPVITYTLILPWAVYHACAKGNVIKE